MEDKKNNDSFFILPCLFRELCEILRIYHRKNKQALFLKETKIHFLWNKWCLFFKSRTEDI